MSTGSGINTGLVLVGADKLMQRTSDNRAEIRSVKRTAGDALEMARRLAESGDWARFIDPKVRDMVVGLAFPAQAAPENVAPFAGAPIIVERPTFGEDVLGDGEYPGPFNEYTPDGDLVSPSQVMGGANFALGVALGFPELRATILGSAFETTPSPEELKQIHRHQRALFAVLRELEGLSKEAAQEAWRRFFHGGGGSSTLWTLLENSPVISAVGGGTYTSFTLPKNYLAVGQTLEVEFGVMLAGSAVACGYSPYLTVGAPSSLTLWSPFADYDPADFAGVSGHGGVVRVQITRRANDSSGGNRFSVSGSFVTNSYCAGNGNHYNLAFDHSIDQQISLCCGQVTAPMASFAYRGTARRL